MLTTYFILLEMKAFQTSPHSVSIDPKRHCSPTLNNLGNINFSFIIIVRGFMLYVYIIIIILNSFKVC